MRFRRIAHGIVDSTNERAFATIANGTARHLDLHVAQGQTAGRGRHGRTWVSEPGGGLYLSLILLPEHTCPPPTLTVATGLALFDAAQRLGVSEARLEWPNDLVLEGAKLAGILVETRGLDPLEPHYVIGIGVNVLQQGFPGALLAERAVTSLALAGHRIGVEQVERELLESLTERLGQVETAPEQLERAYPPAAGLTGHLRVEVPEGVLTGRLSGFSFDRGLALETERGERHVLLEHVRQVSRSGSAG